MPLPTDSAERKAYPVYTGFVRYFPDAIARVAKLSYDGNQKHNPGQPVHWAKEKSTDHRDCEMRHLLDATRLEETVDPLGPEVEEELTCKAWRALADLQIFFDRKAERASIKPFAKIGGDVAGPQDQCTHAFPLTGFPRNPFGGD